MAVEQWIDTEQQWVDSEQQWVSGAAEMVTQDVSGSLGALSGVIDDTIIYTEILGGSI